MVWKPIEDILACDILIFDFSLVRYFDVNMKKWRFAENEISEYISSLLILRKPWKPTGDILTCDL